ncbi:NrsF family protein [Roseomonas sp. CCTCC AB2023176]|uniref:NrsF family protein n=1 Tax=Roseomonas sp. CCTCC AB2023176 TaxID=3342640 RepID=UPI0035DD5A21
MSAEDLIGHLSRDLSPVRPISPWRRGGLLAVLALAVLAAVAGSAGLRADVLARLGLAYEVVQLGASTVTGALGLLSAAMLAQPDRTMAWALLPLPPAILWVSVLGLGCLQDMARMGDAALALQTSWGCFRFILGFGLPMTAVAMLLLRHAWPIRPVPVAVLAALGIAGFCSTALSLIHHLDTGLMVLVWHGASAATLLLAWSLLGRLVPRRA